MGSELLLRVAKYARLHGEEYDQASTVEVRVPGVATVKRALQQAFGASAVSAAADLKAKLVLKTGLEAVSIIDGLPLDLQLDAAASSQRVDLNSLAQPPLLNVFVESTVNGVNRIASANGEGSTRKRSRPSAHSPEQARAGAQQVQGNDAPLASFAARAAARGRGARNPVARSRRRSHVQAAAAIAAAADAERSQRTRRKRPSTGTEHSTPKERANVRVLAEPLVFETVPDTGADTYIAMTLEVPYRLSLRETTLFFALCGALATEQCAMVLPDAEPPLRYMLADVAVVLAATTDLIDRLPKPLVDLITSNLALDSFPLPVLDDLQSNPKMLSRFKATAKRIVANPLLAKSQTQYRSNQAGEGIHSVPDPGDHWKRSGTCKLLTSLVHILPEFAQRIHPQNNHHNRPQAAAN